jgi:hypothetical protein
MLFPLIGFALNFKAHNGSLIIKCILLIFIASLPRFLAGFMTMHYIVAKDVVSIPYRRKFSISFAII